MKIQLFPWCSKIVVFFMWPSAKVLQTCNFPDFWQKSASVMGQMFFLLVLNGTFRRSMCCFRFLGMTRIQVWFEKSTNLPPFNRRTVWKVYVFQQTAQNCFNYKHRPAFDRFRLQASYTRLGLINKGKFNETAFPPHRACGRVEGSFAFCSVSNSGSIKSLLL